MKYSHIKFKILQTFLHNKNYIYNKYLIYNNKSECSISQQLAIKKFSDNYIKNNTKQSIIPLTMVKHIIHELIINLEPFESLLGLQLVNSNPGTYFDLHIKKNEQHITLEIIANNVTSVPLPITIHPTRESIDDYKSGNSLTRKNVVLFYTHQLIKDIVKYHANNIIQQNTSSRIDYNNGDVSEQFCQLSNKIAKNTIRGYATTLLIPQSQVMIFINLPIFTKFNIYDMVLLDTGYLGELTLLVPIKVYVVEGIDKLCLLYSKSVVDVGYGIHLLSLYAHNSSTLGLIGGIYEKNTCKDYVEVIEPITLPT